MINLEENVKWHLEAFASELFVYNRLLLLIIIIFWCFKKLI